jgi:cell division septation protein DedD
VQLGSFASSDSAHRLVGQLAARGFPAYVSASLTSGQLLYRVRTMPATDRAGAVDLAQRLRAGGYEVSVERR